MGDYLDVYAARNNGTSLFERYRPESFSEVLAQDVACKVLQRLIDNKTLTGRAILFTGQTGTGKTTLARIAANAVADPFFIHECDAADLTLAGVREMEAECNHCAWGKGGRVFIVNEIHRLTNATASRLLTTLEAIPKHVLWLFTTTVEGQMTFDGLLDAGPFTGRCLPINLARRGLAEPFAQFVLDVANREGLGGKDYNAALKLVKENRNSLRASLQAVEAGALCS